MLHCFTSIPTSYLTHLNFSDVGRTGIVNLILKMGKLKLRRGRTLD